MVTGGIGSQIHEAFVALDEGRHARGFLVFGLPPASLAHDKPEEILAGLNLDPGRGRGHGYGTVLPRSNNVTARGLWDQSTHEARDRVPAHGGGNAPWMGHRATP